MATKIEEKILPNPNLEREQCIELCKGCEKMFSDKNVGDVCIPFLSPLAKWKNYRKMNKTIHISKVQSKKIVEHYYYCPMATNLEHTYIDGKGKVRVGQQKTKQYRKNR